jgi:predicted exporter
MTLPRWPALLVVIGILAALSFSISRLSGSVDTDILSLLPAYTHDPVLADAVRRASNAASNRVVFAIEGGSAGDRQAARAELSEALVATGRFHTLDDEGEALWRWLFAHRTSLLCEEDRETIEAGRGEVIAQEAFRQWYGPASVGFGGLAAKDPLLLTNRLLNCVLPGASASSAADAEIVSGTIEGSVYRLDVQDDVGTAVAEWRSTWEKSGLSLSRGGALFHAAYGAAQARFEVALIGGVTLCMLLLLYWTMFRSFRAPVLALCMVASALVTGLAAVLAVFGTVHVMALVFGAALIGMVVDYTTYYLVTGLGDAPGTPGERRARLFRPLTLGMLTSAGAFAALLVFPVPAFQQVALFGMSGLAMAWAGTLWLVPHLEAGRTETGPGARRVARGAEAFLSRVPRVTAVWAVTALALFIVFLGWRYGSVLDDVRGLQEPSPVLTAEEAHLRDITGFAPSTSFVLVRGASGAAALRNEEALLAALSPETRDAVTFAASRIDPSAERKRETEKLVRARLLDPHLDAFVADIGVVSQEAYENGLDGTASLPALAVSLRGETDGTAWSIVPVKRAIALPDMGAGRPAPWVLVEPASLYSGLFAEYRRIATLAVAGALLATGLLLLLLERRLPVLRALLPALLATLATPPLVMALGLPFSFFSAMGLFLVVGAGVDYAIFQREPSHPDSRWTRVGIVLAALMTCISVGMLGFSSVLPVKSFGVTVAVGIFLSLVLSPLARGDGLRK